MAKSLTVVLRRQQVEERTGMKRSTIYDHMRLKTFPRPIKIGSRMVGWIESEVEEWIQNKIKKSRV